MTDDIVTRLRYYEKYLIPNVEFPTVQGDLVAAADEIERLHRWASYEHAGYCACAGGDQNCLERAYSGWKKMFDE